MRIDTLALDGAVYFNIDMVTKHNGIKCDLSELSRIDDNKVMTRMYANIKEGYRLTQDFAKVGRRFIYFYFILFFNFSNPDHLHRRR
jgi:hypothetical protein